MADVLQLVFVNRFDMKLCNDFHSTTNDFDTDLAYGTLSVVNAEFIVVTQMHRGVATLRRSVQDNVADLSQELSRGKVVACRTEMAADKFAGWDESWLELPMEYCRAWHFYRWTPSRLRSWRHRAETLKKRADRSPGCSRQIRGVQPVEG